VPSATAPGCFLVAQENCSEALRSHYDRNKLRLVKVHTLKDAISAVGHLARETRPRRCPGAQSE